MVIRARGWRLLNPRVRDYLRWAARRPRDNELPFGPDLYLEDDLADGGYRVVGETPSVLMIPRGRKRC